MTSSLQQGINAAKTGHTQEALNFLKDAIIEEPQNADVWVWVAAIIDDLEKQEIFLEKALKIDPNNIPAQRGLSYLNDRKEHEAFIQDNQLSDETRPISPFPSSTGTNVRKKDQGWLKPSKDEQQDISIQPHQYKNSTEGQKVAKNPNKLSLFEVSLIGIVVIVFSFIGLLTASSLFDFELPLDFLNNNQPKLSAEPPYPGVFLYENEIFFDIQQHKGIPTQDVGIPTSFNTNPMIVFWQTDVASEQIKLIFESGDYISLDTYQGKGGADLFQSKTILATGLYCLQGPLQSPSNGNSTYWCFKIASPPPEG